MIHSLLLFAAAALTMPVGDAFSTGTAARPLPRLRGTPPPRSFATKTTKAAGARSAGGRLRMAAGGDGGTAAPPPPQSINAPLILQSLANQVVIGSTIWTGGSGYQTLVDCAQFGVPSVLLGLVGVVPLIAASRAIETSESPLVSGLNLSTNMAVLNYFGPTKRPVGAAGASLLMACVTAVVEETVFRGQSLPTLANKFGDGDVLTGAVLSTLLFAVLHTNPLGAFKNKEAFVDNLTLLALQLFNGGTFCLLYLLSGNLAVSIVAHAVYDFYTFYKTHVVDVAGQMDYAASEASMPTCSTKRVENAWLNERGEEWLAAAKRSFYLMDTNRDGMLSRKELRIALYGIGVYLSKEQSERVERVADTDESGAIDFDEYLEFIGPTGSSYKAVRYTLLGPT